MSSEDLNIFLIGGTGYIGGAVLLELERSFPSSTLTVLVRKDKDVTAFSRFDVVRSIEEGLANADVVVNVGDSYKVELIKPILDGLAGKEKNERKKLLIHTSGMGAVWVKAEGRYIEGVTKHVSDGPEETKALDPSKPHVSVDKAILETASTGALDSYIIAPSSVYGTTPHPVPRPALVTAFLTHASVARGEVTHINEGTNPWSWVHIDDLVKLYTLVLKKWLGGDASGVYERYFFAAVEDHTTKEHADAVASILHTRGLVSKPTSTGVRPGETHQIIEMLSFSALGKSDRAKSLLGWEPRGKGVLEATVEDVEDALEFDKDSIFSSGAAPDVK